jgi:hypothetical protein
VRWPLMLRSTHERLLDQERELRKRTEARYIRELEDMQKRLPWPSRPAVIERWEVDRG